jgi:RimJ/RimL family protein N-acetyltransferase
LTALYSRLSHETAYRRFFAVMARLPPSWAHILANVDYARRMAIVAVGPDGELVGVARYDLDDVAGTAQVAIVVQDVWQGKGLGAALVMELLQYAQARGIHRFRADVLSENRRMLGMIERLALILERRVEQGVTSLVFAPRSAPRPTHRRVARGAPRTP